MSGLWRGGWTGRARILSGIVLFLFALAHFLNHALGIVSIEAMEAAQVWRVAVTRSLPVTALLALALLVHMALALGQVAMKGTFRMPAPQAFQIASGFAIPFLLLPHVVGTRIAAELLGDATGYGRIVAALASPLPALAQAALLLLVWAHACIGFHHWLREVAWWQAARPVLAALAVLVPALALAGFGAALAEAGAAPARDPGAAARLAEWRAAGLAVLAALLAAAILVNVARRLLRAGRKVDVTFADGPKVQARRGTTLLEVARAEGVSHVALCGGKGRCTTCRVIVERGAQNLSAMGEAERATLAEIGSPPNTRLACQARVLGPATVFRVYDVRRGRARAHASTGVERRMTVLFLDMRGFTARTSGKLPYDVVYLLNRFFDAVIPAVEGHGGRIDKYLGDGFLAVFDLPGGPGPSCRAALEAVVAVDQALVRFNAVLAQEGQPALRIGMGLHVGSLVQGEIGAAGNAPVTVIGDTVNTAARLEGLTKVLSAQALVSRAVLEEAGVPIPSAAFQKLDLKGVGGLVEGLPLRTGTELLPFLASARTPKPA